MIALMTNPWVLLLLATLPGLFYLFLFYRFDKQQREPLSLLIKSFLLGAVLVIPIGLAQSLIDEKLLGQNPLFIFLYMIVVIGFSEELGKWFILRIYIYKKEAFNEVTDGILYGAVVAGGFAVLENIFYVLDHGFSTAILRALLSVPAHLFWGAISGYWLAMYKLQKISRAKMLLNGVLLASLLHGLFNSFLSISSLILLAPVVVIFCGVLVRRHHKKATAFDAQSLTATTIQVQVKSSRYVESQHGSLYEQRSGEFFLRTPPAPNNAKTKNILAMLLRFLGLTFVFFAFAVLSATLEAQNDPQTTQDLKTDLIGVTVFAAIGVMLYILGYRLKKTYEKNTSVPRWELPAPLAKTLAILQYSIGSLFTFAAIGIIASLTETPLQEKPFLFLSLLNSLVMVLLITLLFFLNGRKLWRSRKK